MSTFPTFCMKNYFILYTSLLLHLYDQFIYVKRRKILQNKKCMYTHYMKNNIFRENYSFHFYFS